MSILEIMRSRRSVRSYRDEPLPQEQIDKIIEAGCLAPSSYNGQPWRFVIITDREKINMLSESARAYLQSQVDAPNALELMGSQERLERVSKRLASGVDSVFYGAPLVILVCTEKDGGEYAGMDCGMAGQNMVLYAQEQGLGSCYIGYARHCTREVLIKAGMPENMDLQFALIFGHSDDMEGKGLDRDFDKVVISGQ